MEVGLQKMKLIDAAIVGRMNAMVTCHSAEQIQHLFGISLNTWTKLRQGAPIRASVADRLLQRLERQHPGMTEAGGSGQVFCDGRQSQSPQFLAAA